MDELEDLKADEVTAVDELKADEEELKLDEELNGKRECVICSFSDGELVDTPDGLAHQECLLDREAELHPNNPNSQKAMDEYVKTERDSHLHS